jgi:Holliday junction resolvasome RuvABC ATP-dependent DNA helicase subunit
MNLSPREPLQPNTFLLQLHEKVISLRQPFTWAHIVYTSLLLALKHSSYRNEPLLQVLAAEIQRRALSRVGNLPSEPGFDAEGLTEISRRLREYEGNLARPELLQDRFLRWVASREASPSDWTLPLVTNILAENRLASGHFDGTQPWPMAQALPADLQAMSTPWTEELQDMVGLSEIKQDVLRLRDYLRIQQIRQERGFPTGTISLHQVFYGNPGTGKTSVARILARVYSEFGFLSKGHLIETDRSGLVGTVIGATEAKTEEAIRSAVGGVLFIDEAYSLATESQQDFGQRAIDTLVKSMEDLRGKLVVIVAGYETEMQRFLMANPGLASRFSRYMRFADYENSELLEIFRRLALREHFVLDDDIQPKIAHVLTQRRQRMIERFGNARDVRTLWEASLQRQAARLCESYAGSDIPDPELLKMTAIDVPDTF